MDLNELDKNTLGLPPIELAEYTTSAPARRMSTLRKTLQKWLNLLSSKPCKILACVGVTLIGLLILWRLLPRNENMSDSQKTQILIVTGARQQSNETIPPTDMTVYLQIKDKTSNSTMKRRRRSNSKKYSGLQNEVGKEKIERGSFDVVKARQVIMNDNETCDPENIDVFCKNILDKMNVSVIDENEFLKTEVREFRDTDSSETLITSEVAEDKLARSGGRTSEKSDKSSLISDQAITTIYKHPYPNNDYTSVGLSGHPEHSDQMNYYAVNPYLEPINPYNFAPSYYSYTSQGLINPYMYNLPYTSYSQTWPSYREVASTSLDQSKNPQDIGISTKLKDSEPFPTEAEERPTVRLAGCPIGTAACADSDTCIEDKRWCNGLVDCSDGSDEESCSCRERVDASRLCDGYYDCPFGEDEMGCFGCSEHAFSCDDMDLNSQSTCFEKEQRCDNTVDCPNRKDEVECNMLAPSLHDKPMFAVSHTEGYLHRNYMGKWYPVCENPYIWANDACKREIGLLLRPPFLQIVQVNPSFEGSYINKLQGDLFQISESCANSSAVYVICQDLLCGTRVQTTTQILRENADFENRLFGRNKRSVDSAKLPPANKAAIKTRPSPPTCNRTDAINREFKDVSEGILSIISNESSSDFEAVKYRTGSDVGGRTYRTKRSYSYEGGIRGKRAEGRVVGGRPSQPAAWPWMVAIYQDGVFHCGGVIVSNRWILSAAHCVHMYWEHYYEVQVGMLRRFSFSPQEKNHRVSHVIVNHRYNRADMSNDLSLLRVAPALQFSRWVRPVCLPAQHTAGPQWMWAPPPGTVCVAVGWGATVEHGPDPDHMREVEVPVWARCKHREDQAGREICAGLVEGGRDACQGDSGGPLLCRNPLNSRQWYMAGIVSHGDGCGRRGEPGVYTRVSLYVDWIQFHIVSHNLPRITPKRDCPGFRCESGVSKCLPKKRMCDKTVDCLNAEDEIQCTLLKTATDNNSDNTSILSTDSLQNETQVQSTKTGETTTALNNVILENSEEKTEITSFAKSENKELITEKSKSSEILNKDLEKESQTVDPTKQILQTKHISGFVNDTEDLLANHAVPTYVHSNENNYTHIIPASSRSSESTSLNNPIDGFDTDKKTNIDSELRKMNSIVAASISGSNFKVNIYDSMVNSTSESLKSDDLEEPLRTEFRKINHEMTTDSNFHESISDVDAINVIPHQSTSQPINIFETTEHFADSSNHGSVSFQSIINSSESINQHNPHENINNESSVENQENEKDQIIEPKELPQTLTEKPSPEPQTEGTEKTIIDVLPETQQPPIAPKENSSHNIINEETKKFSPHNKISLTLAHVKQFTSKLDFFECKSMPQIIRPGLRCNHEADCEDGTDEIGCTCVDYLSTFNTNFLCDGFLDCADGLDETNCYECGAEHFFCKWSKTCLPVEYVCDGIFNCPDGEDELDCYALTRGDFMTFDIDGRPKVNLQGFVTKKQKSTWNVVCEEHMDPKRQEIAAAEICHYLGFSEFHDFKIQHINVPDDYQLREFNVTKSKRAIKNEPINFIFQSRDVSSMDDNAQERVIQNPIALPIQCVPNVVRTCMALYVKCAPILNSNLSSHKLVTSQSQAVPQAMRASNEIREQTTEYLWPWAAKVYIEGEYRCTGVLIDLSWVLISDSCLWDTLLSKDYVCVVLGNKRTLAATSGPYEQILEVDGMKDIYDSHVKMLHLRNPALFSRMVKPMVLPSFSLHRTDTEVCVTVGGDREDHSITVLLRETDSDCGMKKRCFERIDSTSACLDGPGSAGKPWAGIITCRAAGDSEGGGAGWFPAASYSEPRGACGLGGGTSADSLAHLRSDIRNIIETAPPGASQAAACGGVRCARGACVPLARACDGVRHCEDGADETDEVCERKNKFCSREPLDSGCRCSSDQLKCHSGRCISKNLFANNRNDCGDGSDEPRRATCAQYLMRVAPHRLCDGRLHCQDRSDEDPAYCKCFSLNIERCPKSDSCVALDMVCDGVRDCPHGEDEATCMALAAPGGTEYGTGEVIVRHYGVWHTKCYHTPNHTRTELENICSDLGFISGHAMQLPATVQPSINLNTHFEFENFTDVALNKHTKILLRSNDRPIARAVVNKDWEDNCYPVHIECV